MRHDTAIRAICIYMYTTLLSGPGKKKKNTTSSVDGDYIASMYIAESFLLEALGWRFSTDPDKFKARDFEPSFDVLGCTD